MSKFKLCSLIILVFLLMGFAESCSFKKEEEKAVDSVKLYQRVFKRSDSLLTIRFILPYSISKSKDLLIFANTYSSLGCIEFPPRYYKFEVQDVLVGKYDYPEILISCQGKTLALEGNKGDTITIDVREIKDEIPSVQRNIFDEKFKGVYRVR